MSHLIVKIFMGLLGLVLVIFLLAVLGLYIVWATLRWLLTGRQPQVVMVWRQFSAMRKNFGQSGFRGAAGAGFKGHRGRGQNPAHNDQVVDADVREVVEDAPRLPSK